MPFGEYFSGERNTATDSKKEPSKEAKSFAVNAHDEALFAVERDAMNKHDDIEAAVKAVREMDTVEDRDAGYAEITEQLATYETFPQTMKMLSFIEDPSISDETLVRIARNKMKYGHVNVAKSFLMKIQNFNRKDEEAEKMGVDIVDAV